MFETCCQWRLYKDCWLLEFLAEIVHEEDSAEEDMYGSDSDRDSEVSEEHSAHHPLVLQNVLV